MNKKKITHLEILFALIIVIAIILMNLIGTTTISDDSVNVNEDGFPTTDKTFEDFKAPGTRLGIMAGTDWGMEVAKRYPEAEIFQYATAADIYTALDTGKVDVAMGFIDQRPDLKESHPDLDKDTKISVQFEYEDSRDGLINMLIKYPGVEKDPFETAVGTSVSLIKHICKDINCCFEDGMQTIRGTN
jgi:hypothetical protein